MPFLLTVQTPEPSVTQELLPPLLQVPVTVAPDTAPWPLLWTLAVTNAFHLVPRVVVDPSRSPKTFDDTVLMGDNQGRVIPGIYEISGDTLKFCFDPDGKQRPLEFKTAPGSQVTLGVYKRVKR